MDNTPLLLIGGAVALALLIMNSAPVSAAINTVIAAGKEMAFKAALPASLQPWSDMMVVASRQYGVSPWLLAGICYRESSGGTALKPPGPAGTGDFNPRPAGRTYSSGYVVGASGMPEDGQGWGRGLMQLDWAVQSPWCQQNPWQDPQTNINKGASVLQSALNYFASNPSDNVGSVNIDSWRLTGLKSATGTVLVQGWGSLYGITDLGPYDDPRPLSGSDLALAGMAAYNAGTSGVLQALAAGLPADAATAGNNYASWIATRVTSWLGSFS